MRRRNFLESLAGLLAFSATFKLSSSALGRPPATEIRRPCRTVYDPRFPLALDTAQPFAIDGHVEPVGSDPTGLALWLRGVDCRDPVIQGVTTEVVPFCLGQLNPHRALRIERLGRDLFYWRI